jgi:microcystin-dependent protein
MSQPFLGTIMMFAGNFAPAGWAECNGALLPIAENDALFALIGTTYGGDGQVTFGLPDLRGRIPIHQGTGPGLSTYVVGQQAGSETVTLVANQMGGHTHQLQSSSGNGSANSPAGAIVAGSALTPYTTSTGNTSFGPSMIGAAGGNQPHENMMPFLALTFVIALFGIFPSQN